MLSTCAKPIPWAYIHLRFGKIWTPAPRCDAFPVYCLAKWNPTGTQLANKSQCNRHNLDLANKAQEIEKPTPPLAAVLARLHPRVKTKYCWRLFVYRRTKTVSNVSASTAALAGATRYWAWPAKWKPFPAPGPLPIPP
ncbi:hypothetical protein BV898_02786 [Hypsibius exemplaris]|uniref:Uncharacterized protein n=1 Tax=Hypsibius exemplaris TaxID=2072580 RepID=A0A1W0X7F5_HYPEX|nr:hypothetical protein BV898_02786 [Hypsibius exemplaris]